MVQDAFLFGGFVLDRRTHQLLFGGKERHLEPKAFELLDLLLVRRPGVVTKADIQQRLWPDTFVSESSLTGLVGQIRRALGDHPRRPRFVRTIHGVGYAFSGKVSVEPPEMVATPVPPGELGREQLDSLAVLPFADLSPQRDQESFCDGLADELIDALTRIRNLRVASRTSSFQFKGTPVDVRDIGQRLGVRAVLEGGVRKDGDRLRITVQITDTLKGFSISSECYDRPVEAVFEVQEEIARLVVTVLEVRLTEGERRGLAQPPTSNLRAYDLFLRGQGFFHQRRAESLELAREMFRMAVAADPAFALAHVGLANACSWLHSVRGRRPEYAAEALSASSRARDLRPDLAETHGARGLALAISDDREAAEVAYRTAISLNPRLFEPHFSYARTCFEQGRLIDAARLFERAAQLRPEDHWCRSLLSMVYTGLGRHDRAREVSEEAVAVAIRHLERHPDDPFAACTIGSLLIRLGQIDRGLGWVERAHKMHPDDGATLYKAACGYALAGRSDQALELLARTISTGFTSPDWITNDPDWAGLRSHPRFAYLVQGLQVACRSSDRTPP